MRILFANPADPSEAAERRLLDNRIEAWWSAFAAKEESIRAMFSRRAEWDLPAWMGEHLGGISRHLMWEFGPAVQCNGHRLVITPETHKNLRPLVDLILLRAPKMAGWEFYPYRLPEDVEHTALTVEGRSGGSLEGIKAHARIGEAKRIDLRFFSPRYRSSEDQQTFNDAFVATETLMGEEILDKWIGAIEVAPLPKERRFFGLLKSPQETPAHMVPLENLKSTVDSLIASILDQLPSSPCHAFGDDDVHWSMLEMKPERAEDYAEQQDMFLGRTPLLDMWKDAHGRGSFYSERHSRCGETFCYVKLDHSGDPSQEWLKRRSEVEDALDAALGPAELGCVVGGGTGLRYSYIDLALADLFSGVEEVRRLLAGSNVSPRSWIQFFDATLRDEWVGAYPDSPPPLMRREE